MRFEPHKKVKWPEGLPKSWFSEPGQSSPDWGASSALFVSLIKAVQNLEQEVGRLRQRVQSLEGGDDWI